MMNTILSPKYDMLRIIVRPEEELMYIGEQIRQITKEMDETTFGAPGDETFNFDESPLPKVKRLYQEALPLLDRADDLKVQINYLNIQETRELMELSSSCSNSNH